MAKLASSPAAARGFRDSAFLLAIAAVSLFGGAVSFYAWQTQPRPVVNATASVEDDAPHMPLPSGPRKYQ
jgi:hypothetical protein